MQPLEAYEHPPIGPGLHPRPATAYHKDRAEDVAASMSLRATIIAPQQLRPTAQFVTSCSCEACSPTHVSRLVCHAAESAATPKCQTSWGRSLLQRAAAANISGSRLKQVGYSSADGSSPSHHLAPSHSISSRSYSRKPPFLRLALMHCRRQAWGKEMLI